MIDHATERLLLGSLMLGNRTACVEGVTLVSARDFHAGAHADVFAAICEVVESGRTPDTPTVVDQLERSGRLEHVGGPADPSKPDGERLSGWRFVAELIRVVPSTVNLRSHAARVVDLSRRRRVAEEAQRLLAAAADLSAPLADSVAACVDNLVTDGTSATGVVDVRDVADDVRSLRETGRATLGVATGWRNVDHIWRPVPGQVTLVAGHPSAGKSAWVDALTVNVGQEHGWRTAMWTPESAPHADHAARLCALVDGVGFDRLAADRLEHALAWVSEHVVWVDHDAHDTVGGILAQVAAVHVRRPLQQVVIDPWTDLDSTRPKGVREDEHINAELTRVRRFARRHNLHALVVVHPRNVDRSSSGVLPVPTPDKFAGGSIWRRKADAIVVVYRDDTADEPESAYVDVHCQKVRRNGVDGLMGRKTTLRFDADSGRYHPLLAPVREAF